MAEQSPKSQATQSLTAVKLSFPARQKQEAGDQSSNPEGSQQNLNLSILNTKLEKPAGPTAPYKPKEGIISTPISGGELIAKKLEIMDSKYMELARLKLFNLGRKDGVVPIDMHVMNYQWKKGERPTGILTEALAKQIHEDFNQHRNKMFEPKVVKEIKGTKNA